MKKVWVLYTGIGHGHKSAAESIKKELEKHDVRVKIFDSAKYANPLISGIVIFLGINIQKYSPKFFNYCYRKVEKHKPRKDLFTRLAIRLFTTKKLTRLIQKEKPDLVISTYFINAWQMSYIKERGLYNVPSISVCTDHIVFSWLLTDEKFIDFFVVADERLKKEMINRGISERKIKDYGIPIRDKFIPKPKKPNSKLKVLFFGGGGLGHEGSLPYLKALQNNDELEIKFISGKNQKLYKKAQKIVSNNTEVIGFSNDVPKLSEWADLAVSKAGGVTVTECINTNTPLVSILSSGGHEKDNVDYAVSKSVGKWCASPTELKTTLQDLSKNRDELTTMQQNCRKIAKPNSARNTAKLALNILSPK